MVFSSIQFLFYFFPCFFLCHFLLPWKNLTLTIFSLLFYAWGEPRFVPILVAYIVANYGCGLVIGAAVGSQRRWAIGVGIALNIGMLVWFKYLNFLTAEFGGVVERLGLPPLEPTHVLLPLGISFMAFQGASYLIDIYRGEVPPQRSLLLFTMYKVMFPQLIAGPIVRYREVYHEIHRRSADIAEIYFGMRQLVTGLAQKVLIANVVAVPADQIFALKPDELGSATAWLGIVCYTLQIYFDFAGYSNMAIGMGRMMGFQYPENFDRPYAAVSITDFWRRWHMTLSRWFRDYVYVPLGGNRRGPVRMYLNMMIVFLLCGLWHGANWTFVVWGAWHGVFLVIERLGFGPVIERAWWPLRHGYTLAVVMIGWVFFRADTLTHAGAFLRSMCGLGGHSLLYPVERYATPTALTALAAGVFLATLPAKQVIARTVQGTAVPVAANALLLCLLALSLLSVAGGNYNPFIYYRF